MAGMHDIKPVPPISPDSRLLKERNIGVKMGVRPDIKLKGGTVYIYICLT